MTHPQPEEQIGAMSEPETNRWPRLFLSHYDNYRHKHYDPPAWAYVGREQWTAFQIYADRLRHTTFTAPCDPLNDCHAEYMGVKIVRVDLKDHFRFTP